VRLENFQPELFSRPGRGYAYSYSTGRGGKVKTDKAQGIIILTTISAAKSLLFIETANARLTKDFPTTLIEARLFL
jgi:hypothetical protein